MILQMRPRREYQVGINRKTNSERMWIKLLRKRGSAMERRSDWNPEDSLERRIDFLIKTDVDNCDLLRLS